MASRSAIAFEESSRRADVAYSIASLEGSALRPMSIHLIFRFARIFACVCTIPSLQGQFAYASNLEDSSRGDVGIGGHGAL